MPSATHPGTHIHAREAHQKPTIIHRPDQRSSTFSVCGNQAPQLRNIQNLKRCASRSMRSVPKMSGVSRKSDTNCITKPPRLSQSCICRSFRVQVAGHERLLRLAASARSSTSPLSSQTKRRREDRQEAEAPPPSPAPTVTGQLCGLRNEDQNGDRELAEHFCQRREGCCP